uniref:GntR family transcriptional regulator n=1 Tax=Rhodococcus sp. T104 TaxID=230533 RepID=B6VJK0_9NOCA|nr:GntR family transcriptional regulator [Rhodococcus sp. T104]
MRSMTDESKNKDGALSTGGSTEEIVGSIQSIITDRSLAPGDRIGAERELAQSLGVSRWTIRRALEQLESQGQILRTHGRSGGIFVAPKKLIRTTPLGGLPVYLRAQGIDSGTTVLGTRAGPPDDEVAKQLGLESDAWVFHIERLRLAGGLPLVLETTDLPCELFPGLLDQPLGSLYEILDSKYDIRPEVTVETITATTADREVAGLLQVSVGSALIFVTRTAELGSGRTFEFSRELWRADRTAITVRSDGKPAYTTIDA